MLIEQFDFLFDGLGFQTTELFTYSFQAAYLAFLVSHSV